MAAVYSDILSEVQADIVALSLSGMAATSIVIAKALPRSEDEFVGGLPGCAIFPFGAIGERPGTNVRDDIVYPVGILLVQAGNQDQATHRDRMLLWLERIRKAFIHQHLTVTSVYTCFVDPKDSFNLDAFRQNYDAGGMVLRFVSRESRG